MPNSWHPIIGQVRSLLHPPAPLHYPNPMLSVVYAIFRAKIRTIDHKKRAALRKAILQDILAKDPGAATMDKARHARIHRGFEEAAQGLPAPSDDHQAWWNDSGTSIHLVVG